MEAASSAVRGRRTVAGIPITIDPGGTTIPSGARLKSVAADAEGIVRADFATTLDRGVGGSCRVAAIREQITRTLKQFPEVRDVVISVNGRTEDILQP